MDSSFAASELYLEQLIDDSHLPGGGSGVSHALETVISLTAKGVASRERLRYTERFYDCTIV